MTRIRYGYRYPSAPPNPVADTLGCLVAILFWLTVIAVCWAFLIWMVVTILRAAGVL